MLMGGRAVADAAQFEGKERGGQAGSWLTDRRDKRIASGGCGQTNKTHRDVDWREGGRAGERGRRERHTRGGG